MNLLSLKDVLNVLLLGTWLAISLIGLIVGLYAAYALVVVGFNLYILLLAVFLIFGGARILAALVEELRT